MDRAQQRQNISMRLSEVLDDLGVSKELVIATRKSLLLRETMLNVMYKLEGDNITAHFFGSSSEGTTIPGLKSDLDLLCYSNNFNVIQDRGEWKAGVKNLLMIEDDTTSPGYCLLQVLRDDGPLPVTDVTDEHFFKDKQGRVLLRNSYIHSSRYPEQQTHGPAHSQEGRGGFMDKDTVIVLPCHTLHPSIRQWLLRQCSWPADTIKSDIAKTRCYVAPVGCKGSVNEELEWRISTSEAERCLMFHLNITQIRVYVLLKMLLKEKINTNIPENSKVSSYMCKTVLFHCIAFTLQYEWLEKNLLLFLRYSLQMLRNCISNEVCAHYFIHTNNLMSRRFTPAAKQQLISNISQVLQDLSRYGFCYIRTLNLTLKLVNKASGYFHPRVALRERALCHSLISRDLQVHAACDRASMRMSAFRNIYQYNSPRQIQTLMKYLQDLKQIFSRGNLLVCSACTFLAPMFCTQIGSALASTSIQASGTISPESLQFFSLGLHLDVSTRLKLATVIYYTGDMGRTETILRDVERRFKFKECESVCRCHIEDRRPIPKSLQRERLKPYIETGNGVDIRTVTASCVIFLPNEVHVLPRELQFEMFRSTTKDLSHRDLRDAWMDWAVVDSLPYLYFLQYKTYGHHRKPADQRRALERLMLFTEKEPRLGHRETAFNLIGQCMEQETRYMDALQCYAMSLRTRRRNNVASLHICRILNVACLMLKVSKNLSNSNRLAADSNRSALKNETSQVIYSRI